MLLFSTDPDRKRDGVLISAPDPLDLSPAERVEIDTIKGGTTWYLSDGPPTGTKVACGSELAQVLRDRGEGRPLSCAVEIVFSINGFGLSGGMLSDGWRLIIGSSLRFSFISSSGPFGVVPRLVLALARPTGTGAQWDRIPGIRAATGRESRQSALGLFSSAGSLNKLVNCSAGKRTETASPDIEVSDCVRSRFFFATVVNHY